MYQILPIPCRYFNTFWSYGAEVVNNTLINNSALNFKVHGVMDDASSFF